jgi:hypothetical protein
MVPQWGAFRFQQLTEPKSKQTRMDSTRASVLQVKHAGKSVLECLGPKFDGPPGRRVFDGQRTIQAASAPRPPTRGIINLRPGNLGGRGALISA